MPGVTSRLAAYSQVVLFFGAFLLFWEFGVRYFEVKSYILPPISAIAVAVWEARSEIFENSMYTLAEVLIGFGAAVVVGVMLGMVVYVSPFAQRTIYPLVTALQTTPKSALAPLMIVWFGYGFISKVAMAFLFAFFPIVVATLGGFAGTAKNLEEHFRALNAGPWRTFTTLRLPSALPSFIDGCRVAMPLAMIGAIIGELVGSERGLGNLIMLGTASTRTDLVFGCIIVITLISLALYALIEFAAKSVWWRGIQV
ncbi:putative aliphatic sulfonates transport permease protein SsuC [Ensifer sp. M14]|jgi:NitT/TauT family transport system permease protein|uniref:ABC transporter permease n=1 Tax=Sinorhizobium/Ensifer group TaxID=227292 RepID=UPI000984AA9E|nr:MULTISPECIES: ABC transporter permease [Sinorhizobium/Ensifer group]OOG70832.1 nitrate ABC transporter permease [Sinorhizobium sp. A49]RDL48791.1 putative aliphatic sulfonates transport permease protein SsuC [Ensifer sp. M14]